MAKTKKSARQTAWLIVVWAFIGIIWIAKGFKAGALTFLGIVIAINLVKLITGREYIIK